MPAVVVPALVAPEVVALEPEVVEPPTVPPETPAVADRFRDVFGVCPLPGPDLE